MAEFDGDGSGISSSGHGFRGGWKLSATSGEVSNGVGEPKRHRQEGGGVSDSGQRDCSHA